MAVTASFWWQTLKKAGDFVINASEEIVGSKLKDQIENKLKPVTRLLQDPEARKAFDRAFDQAAQKFEAAAPNDDERQLRREVIALLGRTTHKGVRDASRDVIQRYVLASEPNRAPLDRWVRRQLGGQQLIVGQRVYPQENVTLALGLFSPVEPGFLGAALFPRAGGPGRHHLAAARNPGRVASHCRRGCPARGLCGLFAASPGLPGPGRYRAQGRQPHGQAAHTRHLCAARGLARGGRGDLAADAQSFETLERPSPGRPGCGGRGPDR